MAHFTTFVIPVNPHSPHPFSFILPISFSHSTLSILVSALSFILSSQLSHLIYQFVLLSFSSQCYSSPFPPASSSYSSSSSCFCFSSTYSHSPFSRVSVKPLASVLLTTFLTRSSHQFPMNLSLSFEWIHGATD